jgi:hypothetical protein
LICAAHVLFYLFSQKIVRLLNYYVLTGYFFYAFRTPLNKGFLETGANPYFTIGFNEGRDYYFNEDHRLRYDWTDAIFYYQDC